MFDQRIWVPAAWGGSAAFG